MSGFRRPPSDVDKMTSLRVDNLPYSAVMEDLQVRGGGVDGGGVWK